MSTPTLDYFQTVRSAMVADIGTLIALESPTSDLDAVAASAAAIATMGERLLGIEPEHITVDNVTHLRWNRGDGENRVLLLAHHDTVWPLGTLNRLPFTTDDGILRGPGSFDMKTGLVMAMYALASLPAELPVTLLVTGDEETGSRTSRPLIEDTARNCSAVLVLEASASGGRLKTARKGVSDYLVTVHGRAAHAGLEPEKGINAAVEAAHQVLALVDVADPARGTTVVPSVVSAGTTTNTVPAHATVAVDVRAWTVEEQTRVHDAIVGLEPALTGCTLTITGSPNRPPLEHTAAADLFATAQDVARQLGLTPPEEAKVGGGSDGNLTAGIGIRTLDGLGAVGDGAHADHEHVVIAEIAPRTALLANLIARLALGATPSLTPSTSTTT